MKADYWNVDDEQVVAKTGKKIADWLPILDRVAPGAKSSNEVVAHLQQHYGVPRYWARTLTTLHAKRRAK